MRATVVGVPLLAAVGAKDGRGVYLRPAGFLVSRAAGLPEHVNIEANLRIWVYVITNKCFSVGYLSFVEFLELICKM